MPASGYVRSFDGASDYITLNIGSCTFESYDQDITIIAVARYSSGTWNSIINSELGTPGTNTARWGLEFSGDEVSYNTDYGDNEVSNGFNLSVDKWAIVTAKRAAGGSTTVEFWCKNLTDGGSWWNAIGASVDTANGRGNPDRIQIGRWQDTDEMNGRIAFAAVYNKLLTDAEIQAIASVSNALDLVPVGAWLFDQETTATSVVDLTGNAANQTALSGTSVVSDTVPNFDLSPAIGIDTPIIDDFNRASIGSDWTALAYANGQLVIDGSIRLKTSDIDAYGGSYWNANIFGPDCEAYLTYVGANGDLGSNYFGLWIRLQDGSDATPDAYIASVSSNTLSLVKKIAGSDTPLGTYTWNPDNGDKFGISCVGDVISVYTDEGAGWVKRISVTDSAITGAGRIAIDIWDPSSDNIFLDNLGGGTLGALELDQIRPDADLETTGWTTTPLYSKINDSSDATVIQATAV